MPCLKSRELIFFLFCLQLMTKMASVIGHDSTIQHFLLPFSELCEDAQLYVRKVCATNFGDFAAVFGPHKTEEMLVSTHSNSIFCEE